MNSEASQSLYTADFFRVMIVFFLLLSTMAMLFLLPIFIDGLGGGAVAIGVMMGTAPVCAVISRLFLGKWMDRAGRKKVLLLSSLLNLVALSLFTTVRSLNLWPLFLRALQGIAYGGFFTAVFTIISDLSPSRRLAEGLGNFGISGMVALAAGPWGGELVLKTAGFKGVFILCGFLSLGAFLVTLSIKESLPGAFCEEFVPSFRKAMGSGVWMVLLITLAFSASRSAVVSFFAEYSVLRGIGSIGLFSLIYSATTIGFRFFTGPLTDRVGRERVLLPALVVFGTGVGLIAVMASAAVFVLAAFLCGLGHCFLYPALNALSIQKAHSCTRGTATGIFTGSFDLGLGVGAWVWGLVAGIGGYPGMYLVAGLCSFIGVGGAVYLLRKKEVKPDGTVGVTARQGKND